MAIACQFDYVKPGSLSEAVRILAGHGPGARVLAGGTDLVGWLRDDLVEPRLLVDIKGIPDLQGITFENDLLRIGSLATFNDLIAAAAVQRHFPLLMEMAKSVASHGIRNRATLAGNICSAVPCCDGGPALLVCEAELRLAGPAGERAVPVGEWFTGPRRTALRDGEILTHIELRRPQSEHGGCYIKLGRYHGEDLAQASVAVLALAGNRYRVAFGAVAPTPVRAPKLEALLEGRPPDAALPAEARSLIAEETAPIADVRASKEYRALMLPIMFERGLAAAGLRLAGRGPAYGEALL